MRGKSLKLWLAAVAVLFLFCGSVKYSHARQGIPVSANIPKNLKKYFVAFLVKSDKWKDGESEAVIGPLVEGHLEHIRAQSEKGKFALVGPFLDNGKMLGMAVVNANSVEEVAQILEGDPFMKTGLVKTDIHPVYLEDLAGVKFEYAQK